VTRAATELPELQTVADYQFGRGAGETLFAGDPRIERTKSGRPNRIHDGEDRLVTYRTDGRFTLGVEGARRLQAAFEAPRLRVVVGEESRPFVREGRNAFAKFVRDVDPTVRPRSEVLVVDGEDGLLGVGRATLSATGAETFGRGTAVKVRHGVPAEDGAGEDGN
jgi:uncharacterized protein with predicted RNA binding PUA domain